VPELPEVETVRLGLQQTTLHQTFTGGQVLLRRIVAYPPVMNDFLDHLNGYTITHWHRRGKYLLAQLEKSTLSGSLSTPSNVISHLGIHLRMTGQLLWVNQIQPLPIHTRVRLFLNAGQELRYVDQRTFGRIWWVPPDKSPESVISGLGNLGLEPLSTQFTVEYLIHQIHHRRRPIKSTLLDQTIIAGMGNIYADEALFVSGINPVTPCSKLTVQQIQRLHHSIVQVLRDSIGLGGTTFRNFVNIKGINGNYGGQAWVYNRERQPCLICTTDIVRLKLSGRSSHFCPVCQPVNEAQ